MTANYRVVDVTGATLASPGKLSVCRGCFPGNAGFGRVETDRPATSSFLQSPKMRGRLKKLGPTD